MTRTSRRSRLATAAVLAPLALGLVACGGDDDSDDTPAPSSTSDSTPDSTSGSTSDSSSASTAVTGDVATAAQTALGEVDGTVFTVDFDDQGWDVSIVTTDGVETDVELDPAGTSVVRSVEDTENDTDDAAERERLLGATVDYAAAIEAAAGESQGTVTGVDLSEENGTAIWEVQFDEDTADELTVEVDAESGEVLRTEQDD